MRKSIEMELQKLVGFEDPDASLEQYETPPELASSLLHFAWSNDDLNGRVLDIGCGTGVLGVGAALYGASSVGIDIDSDAVRLSRANAATADVSSRTDWVRGDVDYLPITSADTVVMNPPFGAQNEGADRPFLRAAEEVAGVAYTVHNSGSLSFVESFVNGEVTDAFETKVVLPHKFEFHEQEKHETEVEVYRIVF